MRLEFPALTAQDRASDLAGDVRPGKGILDAAIAPRHTHAVSSQR